MLKDKFEQNFSLFLGLIGALKSGLLHFKSGFAAVDVEHIISIWYASGPETQPNLDFEIRLCNKTYTLLAAARCHVTVTHMD